MAPPLVSVTELRAQLVRGDAVPVVVDTWPAVRLANEVAATG